MTSSSWLSPPPAPGIGAAKEVKMWTGIVSRKYAEYVMRMPALGGGFIATDIERYSKDGRPLNGFFAAIPDSMTPPSERDGKPMPLAQLRAAMIRENSFLYLGSDEEHADERGFATQSRIQHLLDRLDDADQV